MYMYIHVHVDSLYIYDIHMYAMKMGHKKYLMQLEVRVVPETNVEHFNITQLTKRVVVYYTLFNCFIYSLVCYHSFQVVYY